MLFRDDKTGAVDLAMDAKNPEVLYAGLWEVFRTPYSLSSGGPGSGLFKTTDGGQHWTELTRNPGLPKPHLGQGRRGGVAGADASRVYAIIEAADGGVFLSDDAGATWKLVNDDRRLRQRAFYYTPHLCRSAGQGHGLRPQHRRLPLDGRRQVAADHPRSARRQPRPVDRRQRSRSG